MLQIHCGRFRINLQVVSYSAQDERCRLTAGCHRELLQSFWLKKAERHCRLVHIVAYDFQETDSCPEKSANGQLLSQWGFDTAAGPDGYSSDHPSKYDLLSWLMAGLRAGPETGRQTFQSSSLRDPGQVRPESLSLSAMFHGHAHRH